MPAASSQSPAARRGSASALKLSNAAIGVICLSVALTVSRAHMAVPVLSAIKLPLILNGIALIAILQRFKTLKRAVSRSWGWRILFTIFCFAILGIPFSIYPGQSLSFLTDAFVKSLLIGLLAFAVTYSETGVRAVARALLAAGVVAAAMALAWSRRDGDGRLSGAFTYDANDLALICAVTIPLCLWHFFEEKRARRWIALAACALLLFVIIKSGSRGGFLGIATVALYFLVAGVMRRARRTSIIAATIVVGVAIAVPLAPAEYRARLMTIGAAEDDYNFTSYSGRLEVWKRGIGYIAQRPIFGVGLDNYRTAEGRLSEVARERARAGRGMKWSTAHNSYLQVLVELGLVPGVLFFALAFSAPIALLRSARSGSIDRAAGTDFLAVCLGASLIAFAVCGFFLSFAYYDIVYILHGMAAAILLRSSGRNSVAATTRYGSEATSRSRTANPSVAAPWQ